MKVILIAGPKNHGKNYLANLLQQHKFDTIHEQYNILSKNSINFEFKENVNLFAFADKLKQEYCDFCKIDYTQFENVKEEHRTQLQHFSRIHLDEDPDYYTKYIFNNILENNNYVSIITDFRQQSEFEYLKKMDNVKILRFYVYDNMKGQDRSDKWENQLDMNDFDVVFSRRA